MSFELAGKVIGDPEITSIQEFTVLLALADATNKETHTCYPSAHRIAFVARITRRRVFIILKTLEKKGWIQILRRHSTKKVPRASIYRITKYGVPSTPSIVSPGHHGDSVPQTPYSVPRTPKPVIGTNKKKTTNKEPSDLSCSWLSQPIPEESLDPPDPKILSGFKSLKRKLTTRRPSLDGPAGGNT